MNIAELRFLVVEDHSFQRWALGNMLSNLGARHVVCAAGGQEALDIIDEVAEPFDIVVSDLQMPGMDGMELIRHLAAGGSAPSIILTSALDRAVLNSVEAMTEAYGMAILGGIEKPVTAKKLLATIERHDAAPAPVLAKPQLALGPADVARALGTGDLHAFFQPKVDIARGRLKGAEALARWRLADGHMASPAQFMPMLEAAGFGDQLLERMLRSAAQCLRLLRPYEADITIAVNLSFDALGDLRLGERLRSIVTDEGAEPHQFILEVTESANAAKLVHALENLARLRMMGFGLSIDDCGTGYASLQRLADMPFTELKVDRLFVHGADSRPEARAILESTLQMARALGLVAVAEGVERHEDWCVLRELQCDLAQGYLVARPMPCPAFVDWARTEGRP